MARPSGRGSVLGLQRKAGNRATRALLLRKPKVAQPPPPKKPTAAQHAQSVRAEAETQWKAYKAYVTSRATPQLSGVKQRIVAYLDRYEKAYGTFAATLSDAEQAVAERQKWTDVVKGILIGTGIGLAAGELYAAQTVLKKVLYEMAGEGAEAIVGAGAAAEPASFAPPADLSSDKEALKHWKLLSGAWESLALLNAAGLKFDDFVEGVRDAAEGLEHLEAGKRAPKPAADYEATVKKAEQGDELGKLKQALADTEAALAKFVAAVDTPVLQRDARHLEQDMWVRWIARINQGRQIVFKDVSTWDVKTNQQARADYRRVYASLDEDAVKQRLKELDLGWALQNWAKSGDEMEALTRFYHWTLREQENLGLVGRLGIVVLAPPLAPPGESPRTQPGVVKLRHDIYATTSRQDPDPSGKARYVEIENDAKTPLRVGQVVLLESTSRASALGRFQVRPFSPSTAPQRVRHDESNDALRALGYDAANFRIGPQSGDSLDGLTVENLLPLVAQALGPPLIRQMRAKVSEIPGAGVLISHADGTPLLLVAPAGGLDTVGGIMDKDKAHALRAVVVNDRPGATVHADFARLGVVGAALPYAVTVIQSQYHAAHDEHAAKAKKR